MKSPSARDICQAAVSSGGYLLAWYGRCETDGSHGLTVIASAGDSLGYLDGITVTWGDDQPTSLGPAGTAASSGAPAIFNNIHNSHLFTPWAERAAEYGIRSVLSVPVFVGGAVEGVISLYSAHPNAFTSSTAEVLETLCSHVGIGLEKLRAVDDRRIAMEGTIGVLTTALEARDPYTAGHQLSVSDLSLLTAKRLGMVEHEINVIRLSAIVHDIGKIGVPTSLLAKPTKLRPAEMDLIKEHAIIGEEILSTVNFPWPIAQIVGQHHERMDGSGYPRGLDGNDILMPARVIAVADVIEAMAHDRPYRRALSLEDTLRWVASQAGTQFDRDVVDAVTAVIKDAEYRF